MEFLLEQDIDRYAAYRVVWYGPWLLLLPQ
jgi:hypothetical protein